MAPPRPAEARLVVRVIPKGGRDGVDGVRDGVLIVRVSAAPVDGAANAALCRVIAGSLGVPVSLVRVISGGSGRRKVLGIGGVDKAAIAARWPDLGV